MAGHPDQPIEHNDDQKKQGFFEKLIDKFQHTVHKTSNKGEAHYDTEPASAPTPTPARAAPVTMDDTTTLDNKQPEGGSDVKDDITGTHDLTQEMLSKVGHEGEHHGGVPTFLVALPDQDIPEEVTKETSSDVKDDSSRSHDLTQEMLSKVGHEGEHHGGVPTFLVALPDQDIPDEVTKETSSDVKEESSRSHDLTQEMLSKVGHEGEHHGGVPTFLVALPDQDIPDEVTKETSSDVKDGTSGTHDLTQEMLSKVGHEGEHHGGVPTFLVALPDQDIPEEVTKQTSADERM